MASFIDNLDIFRTGFTFSNQISTVFSKIFTLSYVVLFLYFAAMSLITITVDNKIEVTNVFTYETNYTSDVNTYKQMNIILYMQLYSNNATTLDDKEAQQLIDSNLDIKVYSINSAINRYQSNKLANYKCGQKQNMLLYCLTHEVNSLSDFISITFNKPILLPQSDFNDFLNSYTIRYHIDYYFIKDCSEENSFFKVGEVNNYLLTDNQVFKDNGLFGYISNTYGSFKLIFNNKSVNRDYIFFFNILRLNLDSSVFFSRNFVFDSFQYNKMITDDTNNLLSFSFNVMPLAQTYYFKYKKLQTSLAEAAGILNIIKFIGVTIIIILNFVRQHSHVAGQFYKNNMIFKKTLLSKPNSPLDSSASNNNLKPVSPFGLVPKKDNFVETRGRNEESSIPKILIRPRSSTGILSEEEQLQALVKSLRVKNNKLFNLVSFLKILCFGCCNKTRRTKFHIYKNLVYENLKRMDFMYFMEKIKQIDVLAYLLLDETQRAMLDFIDKEQVIYSTIYKSCVFRSKWNADLSENDKVQKLTRFIQRFRNNTCSELDRKFLQVINEDVTIIGKLGGRT
jgi:hypothetical protein